ncbi:MAG: AAA family ATPase [Micromonosporaceae bacterium]|nr:AAA family ATPase [Micromonosporaceae bacterium]
MRDTAAGQGRRPCRLVRRPVDAAPLELDEAQRRVVAHSGGPLLVLGGPGAGKTAALVESAAARVAEGADPERILVFAFSRRAGQRLRARIATRLGVAGAPGVARPEPQVRTFHAYAFALLRRIAARRGEPPPRLLTGPEQDLMIRELLAADPAGVRIGWPVSLRPALRTRGFAAELRDLLLRAAERGVTPEQLDRLGARLGREDWRAAARFAEQYADVLALRDATTRGSVAYDTAELIRAAAAQLAADPDAHADERARLRHVYVDELHDTDPAQWELLRLIAGDGGNLVGFADPDSSTFAFRGADPAEVFDFTERFHTLSGDPAPAIPLTTCWRSGAELVDAAGRIAGRLRGPARHRVRRAAPDLPPGEVEVRLLRSATQEAAYLAHRLRAAHLLDGVPWSRMAVLLRASSHQLAGLRRALTHAGVPVRVAAEDLPLAAQPAVSALLLLLRCAAQPERLDEEAAVALLHSPLGGADPFAERRLRQELRALALAAGDHKPTGALLVEALADPAELAAVDSRWAAPAQRVASLLALARDVVAHRAATAEEVLWEVWQGSGLARRWAGAAVAGGRRGAAADRDLDAVVALFDRAAQFADRLPGAGPEVFCDHVLGQEIPADSLAPSADRGEAVRLLTVHAAKGREWDVVAVPGMQEGRWPDLRRRGSVLGSELLVDHVAGRAFGDQSGLLAARLDEERRLAYVAATRARHRLIVTAVASGDGEEQPSRFIDELCPPEPEPDPDEVDLGSVEAAAESELPTARPHADLPQALTLPALTAQLRAVAVDASASLARRREAARQLARLAAAGVPGAHPDDWWGLRPLSDPGRLAGPGERVDVSPSVVDQVRRCGLRWLLERHGGKGPPGPEQTVGSLVHAAAERAASVLADPQALYRYLDEHWGVVEVAARWEQGRKREQAEQMIGRFLGWLAANPRELLAAEQPFRVRLPSADPHDPAVEIVGAVDRIERDAAGRLVVIDLKTGKSAPTADEVGEHPQLGTYQLAVALGGFAALAGDAEDSAAGSGREVGDSEGPASGAEEAGVGPGGVEPGGAALVQLGKDRRAGPEQRQPALSEADDPAWAETMVRDAAASMSSDTFTAQVNQWCPVCAVQSSCPLSEHGRQVIEPPTVPPRDEEPGEQEAPE